MRIILRRRGKETVMGRTWVCVAIIAAVAAPGAARAEGTWEVTPAGEEAARHVRLYIQ